MGHAASVNTVDNADPVLVRANSNSALLYYRAQLSKAGKELLDEFISSNGADVDLIEAKLKELLISHPLPDILMISFNELKALGTFPRCPENRNITTPLKEIDRDHSLLIFISHCWMRGYPGAEGWDGRPHPDNAAGDKYKLCISGIESIKNNLAPRMKNCYVWLDFGCINQDGNPAGELEQLDKIVECCDAIFSPIVDIDHKSWSLPQSIDNYYEQYKAKLWNDGPHAYLNRGWCRVEMLYAANIPILDNENVEIKRHSMFDAGLSYHCSQNRRPHFVFGTGECVSNMLPITIPPLQHSFFAEYHPSKGNISVESDRPHIESLVNDLQPYIDANKVSPGYTGEVDEQNESHGYGTYVYESGDVYTGEWVHGKKHGKGVYRGIDGIFYEGEFVEDSMEGFGVYKSASGNSYEGQWLNNEKSGRGIYRFANGNVYEGEFLNNARDGMGKFSWDNGDVFEGMFKGHYRHGHGVFKCAATGTIEEGEWENDVQLPTQ